QCPIRTISMLQLSAVRSDTLGLLDELMQIEFLKHFHLVGGTALALHFGHRLSEDIDLFTQEEFDYKQVIGELRLNYDQLILENEAKNTLMVRIKGIKVDFIRHNYPLLKPPIIENDYRLWSIQDISAMKLNAIA